MNKFYYWIVYDRMGNQHRGACKADSPREAGRKAEKETCGNAQNVFVYADPHDFFEGKPVDMYQVNI